MNDKKVDRWNTGHRGMSNTTLLPTVIGKNTPTMNTSLFHIPRVVALGDMVTMKHMNTGPILKNRLVENVNGHATSEKRTTGRRQHRKHTAGGGTVDGVMMTINLDGLNGQTTATQHDKRRNTALRRTELGNQHHLGKAVKKSQPRNLNVWRTDTTAHPKKL